MAVASYVIESAFSTRCGLSTVSETQDWPLQILTQHGGYVLGFATLSSTRCGTNDNWINSWGADQEDYLPCDG